MKQVLCNLVKNAIKFTNRGLILLIVSYDSPRGEIVVKVADTGKGIAAGEIPTLCQKFGKLLRTAEMNCEGVGLGLMVSKALIEANGGELKIESEGVSQGSCFTFTMKMHDLVSARSIHLRRQNQLIKLQTSISSTNRSMNQSSMRFNFQRNEQRIEADSASKN